MHCPTQEASTSASPCWYSVYLSVLIKKIQACKQRHSLIHIYEITDHMQDTLLGLSLSENET